MKKLMILSTGGTIACTQTADGLIPTLSCGRYLRLCSERKDDRADRDKNDLQPRQFQYPAGGVADHRAARCSIACRTTTASWCCTARTRWRIPRACSPLCCAIPANPSSSRAPSCRSVIRRRTRKLNLRDALITAASGIPGVFVVFDRQIMLGCRVAKVRTTSQNAFESINRPPVGACALRTGAPDRPAGTAAG